MITVEKILEVIHKYHMIEKGDRVMIGVSGGADSMCLLFLMSSLRQELDISIEAVHVHHGIRGKSADRDLHFVEEECRNLNIPFTAVRVDIPAISKREGLSEEEAGRIERYRIFNERDADRIGIAHHLEDSAETTLFNLFRGTGIKGLGGIRPVSGRIIRPLITCTRAEIEEYCRENGIRYCEDETNSDAAIARNRIRLNILPEAELINPAASRHVEEASERIREVWDYMDSEAQRLFSEAADLTEMPERLKVRADILENAAPVLRSMAVRKCITLFAGREKDISSVHVNDTEKLLIKGSGKEVHLPYGITVRKSFDALTFSKGKKGKDEICPEIPFKIEEGKEIVVTLPDGSAAAGSITEKPENIPILGYTKWLDYGKIKGGAVWRTRRAGDRISIQGGSKKLKDYLIEEKVPSEDRDSIFLLASGQDVIWVPGLRIGYGFRVTDSTEKVLKVTIKDHKERNWEHGGKDQCTV